MKTILATVYALNPNKGSEDGMGWNFVCQIARYHKVIAITRQNNRVAIEEYMRKHPDSFHQNIRFAYYDLPTYLRFWKKGNRGAMLYYYLWQLFLPIFVKNKKLCFDIAHNLNFHNDWTPSMLWTLGKPMVWGPIGHHPRIPKSYLQPIYGWKAYLKDSATWLLKQFFWKLDPLLKLTKAKAAHIYAMNSSVEHVLNLRSDQLSIMPSVASEEVEPLRETKEQFNVISVGRFVPLKGFDVTLKSFAHFYHSLPYPQRENVRLTLVGQGPQKKFLISLAFRYKIRHAVKFIDWIERSELQSIYRRASVFFFPSHEGAGMVVSEAMSFGLPILCFDNVGPGEFINHDCGRKVKYDQYENSVASFSNHLNEMFNDRIMLQKMSVAALIHFRLNFRWYIRGEQLKQTYQDILLRKESLKVVEQSVQVKHAASV